MQYQTKRAAEQLLHSPIKCRPPALLRRRIGDIDLAVEPVQQQRGRHAEDQTQGVGNAALHTAYEARKRDNGQCRGKDDADDDMKPWNDAFCSR